MSFVREYILTTSKRIKYIYIYIYDLKVIKCYHHRHICILNIRCPIMSLFIYRYLKMPKALGEILYRILECVLLL